MIQRIKTKLLVLASAAMVAVPVAIPAVAQAQAANPVQQGVCKGAEDLQFGAGKNCDTTVTESSLNSTITVIINILSVIVGIIAVIMIIIGGFRYITSGGDSTKVGSAKNTILYALIGLIIVAIAQLIVRFVLGKASTVA